MDKFIDLGKAASATITCSKSGYGFTFKGNQTKKEPDFIERAVGS